ncbi:MAG: hypothetical protein DRR16_14930 [Candidatus Parabeggiatoa sp. nov. 3]|nr:MAG: hypothetical protein DRR00_12450 [Gammaproteobacteria bacterium]RKZ68186.1 MAG: hypothetical protein DRQ99_04450 [Gammaproteobacteria bacterium]RKZ84343.1 MAG: hypothetical protein DRR16_14930 [Gammaproteobacteria bacterium]
MTAEERKRYEDYLKNTVIEEDVIKTARKEGREEGKCEVAIKLLAQGMEIETIATLTDLSVDVIKSVSGETD